MPIYLDVFVTSLVVSLLLVMTKRWHGHFSLDHTAGVQKFHTKPTPRIGGVAIATGMVCAWVVAPPPVKALLGPLLLAGVPAFAAGLLEDVTKKVGVRARLLATMVSGALACGITGIALNRVGIPFVNEWLTWMPLAVAFTAFAAAGVANAINIIDGFNGLSSGTSLIALAALGSMATLQGDVALALSCALVAAAVLGFLVVNFPLGKLFLGDGGAYLIGFALAWLAVLLLMRNPAVSAWAALLACGYPVIEVLYSVWRRWRKKAPAGEPDSLHLHSLVKTQVIMRWMPHWRPRLRNAAVSPLMWLYAALPATLAVVLEGASRSVLALAFVGCVLVYHLLYQGLARRARLHPIPDSDLAALTRNRVATPPATPPAAPPPAQTTQVEH
ncbi:glycosyltransferase [Hydrogenophaga sp.]|uniref:MraY family glycosyltransferase n=1 Tax=Hydrogenophaga sp. TaxID=1904254 RepID=UPI003567A916